MEISTNLEADALGFMIGIGLIYFGVTQYLLAQKINNTPTSKVQSAAVGLIELCGKAECRDPTVSPISKVKCVYWRIRGELNRDNSNYLEQEDVAYGRLRQMFYRDSSKPFYLEDETGRMLVDPKDGDVDIPCNKVYDGYLSPGKRLFGIVPLTPLPAEALDFINGLDPAGKAAFMAHPNVNLRILEYYIAEGDPLYVLGSAVPQDGAGSSVGHANLMVKKGRDNIMYVSKTGEKKLVNRITWVMYLAIFGGLALSAISLFMFILFTFVIPSVFHSILTH